MVPLASTVPLAIGAALPRGRPQYAGAWIAYGRVPRIPGSPRRVYHLTTLGYWYVPTAPP
jgi:hypothetical protein